MTNQRIRPFLVTDLYEVTMAASYLRRGMLAPATFSMFVRRLPPSRGFLVAVGVDEAIDRLMAFEVTDHDVDALAGLLGCSPRMLEPLRGLRFAGDVRAVEEGRVVLADEPLLEVTAPLPQAQLVETAVLNAVTYH
jgi:nicotinate phosphoribosyltransferase